MAVFTVVHVIDTDYNFCTVSLFGGNEAAFNRWLALKNKLADNCHCVVPLRPNFRSLPGSHLSNPLQHWHTLQSWLQSPYSQYTRNQNSMWYLNILHRSMHHWTSAKVLPTPQSDYLKPRQLRQLLEIWMKVLHSAEDITVAFQPFDGAWMGGYLQHFHRACRLRKERQDVCRHTLSIWNIRQHIPTSLHHSWGRWSLITILVQPAEKWRRWRQGWHSQPTKQQSSLYSITQSDAECCP